MTHLYLINFQPKYQTKNFKFEGFHGTLAENLDSIKKNNFYEIGSDEWAGDGAYFFVHGLSESPAKDAQRWVISKLVKNNVNPNSVKIIVVKAIIKATASNFLDLTTTEGIKIFNYTRQQMLEKVKGGGYVLSKKSGEDFQDGHIINQIRKHSSIKIVKMHSYIMFTEEKEISLRSRIPNTTIISVIETGSNIAKNSINEIGGE